MPSNRSRVLRLQPLELARQGVGIADRWRAAARSCGWTAGAAPLAGGGRRVGDLHGAAAVVRRWLRPAAAAGAARSRRLDARQAGRSTLRRRRRRLGGRVSVGRAAESGKMPRLTAAAFCPAESAGSRWRNGATCAQLPGIAALIALIARVACRRSARGRRRGRAAAPASPLRRKRRKRLQRRVAVAADRQAEREPAARFVARRRPLERGAIIGLRLRLLAEQVIGEAAVAGEGRDRRAELLRALEIGQRRLRVAVGDRHRAHAGLRQRAAAD